MAKKQSKPKVIDIRKTGPQSYKTLQQENNPYGTSEFDNLAMPRQYTASDFVYTGYEMSPMQQSGNGYWGESMFDEETANEEDWQNNLQDIRANNQPWYAQLGAGIVKGAALAGTTFLDGTVGLLAGVAEMPNKGMSALWNNEFSNTLADINQQMEQWLPNYKTQEEQERPWWQNLGTVNFWADSFIKNMGFTVGAFYSGAAWTKGLKALGVLKGSTAAKGIGSVLSAVNEGRIEANNGSREFLDLKYAEIEDATNRAYRDIMESQLSDTDKEIAINDVYARAEELKADAQDKADAMGLTTLMGNTVLLTLDNLWSFGKLYARGFNDAKGGLGSKIKNAVTVGTESEAAAAAGENVVKEGGKYAWKDITKGQAIKRGLTTGLTEGNEEMAQGAIQAFAGNRVSYDSPDAYYEALTNPDAQLKTKDTMTSLTEAMKDTYGNGDRWEEFAVGFLTGIFGTPTFGKVSNSDANTYLGRGKMIGMSGGLFGEIGVAGMRNREGRAAVETANKYMDKLRAKTGHFVQSTAFTNAMNGFAEEDDKFEFKNAEDNDDFAAISSFAKIGKLNDLKELVNQDFENMSDEQLADIAINTSRDFTMDNEGRANTTDAEGNTAQGGWRFSDGSLMSDSEEGREMMRNELKNKRDKILKEIDRYEDSVETVRAIGNNSLSDDQVNELAWLHWKIGAFDERFKDVKEKNSNFFNDLEKSINAFLRGRGQGGRSESDIKNMESTLQFIKALRDADSPLKLASLVENNFEHTWFLGKGAWPMLEGISGLDNETFDKGMRDLWDLSRMAIASKQFNERYKEFKADPTKLIENRNNIDEKNEKKKEIQNEINLKDKIHNSNVSDIVTGVREGNLSLDQVKSQMDNIEDLLGDTDVDAEERGSQSVKQKVAEVEAILNREKSIEQVLAEKKAEAFENDNKEALQAIEDMEAMLDKNMQAVEKVSDVLDTSTQAFNDPESLNLGSAVEELMNNGWDQEAAEKEVEKAALDRIDAVKSLVEEVKSKLEEKEDKLSKLPIPEGPENTDDNTAPGSAVTPKNDNTDNGETGHDIVPRVETENERKKKEKEDEEKRKKAIDDRFKQEEAELEARRDLMALIGGDKNAIHALNGVIDAIETGIKRGLKGKDLGEEVKDTDSYKYLASMIGEDNAKKILNKYNKARQSHLNTTDNSTRKNTVTPTSDTEITEKEKEEDLNAPTPDISVINLNTYSDNYNNQGSEKLEKENGSYQFWFPATREFAMGRNKGEYVPFHVVARNLKKADGSPLYSEAQLTRMEAVFNYLQEKQAFNLVNNGAVQGEKNKKYHAKDSSKIKGDEIHFIIDPALNERAHEVVVLMADSQGRILGDLCSPTDISAPAQVGLLDFYKRILQEYAESGNKESGEIFTSSETTTVDKNMVGKVPFLKNNEKRNTINQIFTEDGKEIPFKLGVAVEDGKNAKILMTPGKTAKAGRSKEEESIRPPLTAVKGQPYLLMPTGDKTGNSQWICVPFTMPRYSTALANTAMGKAIHSALELIKTSGETPMDAVRAIRELLSNEIHINYSGDNNERVKVTIVPRGSVKQVTIYNGPVNNENLVPIIEKGLATHEATFQVSRKYYNTKYDGQDYNRMIGELAEINLPIGATHTVGEWFVIKPLVGQNKQGKTRAPRTLGENPNARTNNGVYEVRLGSLTFTVDVEKEEITNSNGDIIDTPQARIAFAHAYGIHTKKDMTKPYDTSKGYYNPIIRKFIEKKTSTNNITKEEKVIKEGIQTAIEALGESVDKDAAKVKETDINNWLGKPAIEKVIRSFVKDNSTVEDVINSIKEEVPDSRPDLVNTLDDVLRFDSSKEIVKTYIEKELNTRKESSIQTQVSTIKTSATTRKGRQVEGAYNVEVREGIIDYKYTGPSIAKYKIKVNTRKEAEELVGDGWNDEGNREEAINILLGKDEVFENGLGIDRVVIRSDGSISIYTDDQFSIEGEPAKKLARELGFINNEEQPQAPAQESPQTGQVEGSQEEEAVSIEDLLGYGSLDEFNDDLKAAESEVNKRNTASEEGSVDDTLKKEAQKPAEVKEQEEQISDIDKAKKADLLNTPTRQAVWGALTTDQQHILVGKIKAKQKQMIRILEKAYDPSTNSFNESILGKSIDKFFDKPKLRKASEAQSIDRLKKEKRAERKKEIDWIKRALPQLSHADHLRIHNGLIRVSDNDNPAYAYGMFFRGVMTVSDIAASGTMYHEAFHAVTDMLLSGAERDELFDAAREKYGELSELDLEENLAEDFRRYVQLEEKPVIGKLVKLFRTLKRILQNLTGRKPYIDRVFYNINRGKYRNDILTQAQQEESAKYLEEEVANEEMSAIREKAIADGTFMKAPNGQPTNLTERQWLQVRTQAFKNWFGDWENDPANASKVVDENGEPLVLIHNTKVPNIRIFKKGLGGAMFFADAIAQNYVLGFARGNVNYEVFLNIRNPETENYEEGYIDEKEGIDGVFVSEEVNEGIGHAAIVKRPNQIKSATDNIGTFSTENDDIRYMMAPGFGGTVSDFQDIVDSNINNPTFRWKSQALKNNAWGRLRDLWLREGYDVKGHKDSNGNWKVSSVKRVQPKYRKVEVHTPIKDKYKGKLIYAQAGTGKTTIADNITVIDADFLLAKLLGVETNQAGAAFKLLPSDEKQDISLLYRNAIREEVQKGHTVITANNSMLDEADLIVYNESAELTDKRTSGITRTNKFSNITYQNDTLNIIEQYLANNNKESVALSEGEYLGDVLLTDPAFNIGNAEIIANNPTLMSLMTDFLGQYGITFEEFNKKGYSIDYLEKVISGATDDDKIEGASEMIAFMMQHNGMVKPLIAQMAVEDGTIDGSIYFPKGHNRAGQINDKVYKQLNRGKYVKVLAQAIKEELEYQYGVLKGTRKENKNRYKDSFWQKIKDIISKFFDKIISNKPLIDGIRDYARYVATNVMQKNKGLITASITKPGDKSGQIARPVDVQRAMREFPYEFDIVKKMSSVGITLAGSTSMAIQGTVFRPMENPLHDLDFGTPDNTTRESLEAMITPLFDNLQHLRTIENEGGKATETYVVMNEPFTIEHVIAQNYIIRDLNGEQIAHIDTSEIVYDKPGLQGKILDFFTRYEREFPIVPYKVGDDIIYMNNYREAMTAKVDWQRLKDMFDFNRFIPFYKMSEDAIREYETTEERINRIRQHYRDKMMYANLNDEDKQYLKDRHITIEEYNNMTDKEKEVLFKCKGW